jgi:hypothetical protein
LRAFARRATFVEVTAFRRRRPRDPRAALSAEATCRCRAGRRLRGFGEAAAPLLVLSGPSRLPTACVTVFMTVSPIVVNVESEPVRVRLPECTSHGFLILSDGSGTALAHGELIQWLERSTVASRLVIRFKDGSVYDELVRFTQRPVFRLVSYRLTQRGPAFTETADIEFDRSGRYRVRRRAKPGEKEEHAAGHVEIPDDVSNGLIFTLLKNLAPGVSVTTHVLTFRPKPLVLELRLTP